MPALNRQLSLHRHRQVVVSPPGILFFRVPNCTLSKARLMTRIACSHFLALTLVLALGCGGGSTGPKLIPASGSVMIDGQPAAAGILITFAPNGGKGTKGPQSSAATTADGKFALRGIDNQMGAVVGHHKVTVNCPMGVMEGSSATGATPSVPATACEIAQLFRDGATTTLMVEIKEKADENQKILIEVTSK